MNKVHSALRQIAPEQLANENWLPDMAALLSKDIKNIFQGELASPVRDNFDRNAL